MTAGTTTRGLPIQIDGLSKHFGPVVAVDNLSFTVEPGRVTGFLGPNGSGKTTTLRMLLGLVHPSAGTATIAGRTYQDLENPRRPSAPCWRRPASTRRGAPAPTCAWRPAPAATTRSGPTRCSSWSA